MKELTSSDLLYSTGLLNTPKKYYASTTAYKGRAAYVAFDIPVEEGYIYKFEFTSTASSPEFGAIIINDTALSLVEQKLDHGLENQFNTGWQKSGLTVEIPASINGSDAAVVRFNFRSNDDSITEDFITGVTISRCRVR